MSGEPRQRRSERSAAGERLHFRKQAFATRIGAVLFVCGAVLVAAATVAPHSARMEVTGFRWLAAFELLAAAILVALPGERRSAGWIPGGIVVAGIGVVTAATYLNGERLGGEPGFNEFFYVWPAFYFGYFFRIRGILASLLLIGVAYAGVLVAVDPGLAVAFTRWVATLSVVSGAAVALHLLRREVDGLVGRLRQAARVDPLTTLLNRRGFDERFGLELERARRTDAPLTLVLGDLDRFKELNDRFGHAAGDRALAQVGRALASGCRAIDTVARIGGEEFALLLPATAESGGLEAAERLRGDLAEIVDADGRPLTISFGIVGFPAHAQTAEDLMRAADRALYAAKARGRDRTVVHGLRDAPAAA